MDKDSLIKKFYKFSKHKKLDKFYDYIEKNSLKEIFLQGAFMDAFESKQDKDYTDLINFSLKISMEDLKKGFGEKIAKRFAELISKEKYAKNQMINLTNLRFFANNAQYIDQEDSINRILDIFSEEGMTCGTHITGSELRRNNK